MENLKPTNKHMKQVTFRGSGQLRGVISIDKTIELEDIIAASLFGPKRNEVKLSILSVHFPGVKFNPNQIVCDVKSIKENKTHAVTKSRTNNTSKKKSFSLFSIITFLLFWPFKLVWWLIKKIWKEDHI